MRDVLHRTLIACLLILAGSRAVLAQTAPTPAILVLGDSISAAYGLNVNEGWVALMGQKLDRAGYGYHLVNASVSGETTAGALARLPHLLDVNHPRIVIIELGGNDGLRGLPVPEARANLARIVELARAAGAKPLLLGMRVPPNYGPQYTAAFAAMYDDTARELHVPLVPFLLSSIAASDSNFQADRIHPTAAAQPALVDVVWPMLTPLLGKDKAGSAGSVARSATTTGH